MPALPTPPHPSYVSGHSIFSAAAAVALSGLYPSLADRFANAAAEASDSRVLAGIHYWFDCSRGVEAGGRIGKVALERFGLDADAGLPNSKKTFQDAGSTPRDAEAGAGGIRLDG
jgi:hypothetical protein